MNDNRTTSDRRKYPATLAALWKRGFTYVSMPLDSRAFDQVQEILSKAQLGGQLSLRTVGKNTKDKHGETFPDAFLEYLTPEEVAAEKRRYEDYKGAASGAGGL